MVNAESQRRAKSVGARVLAVMLGMAVAFGAVGCTEVREPVTLTVGASWAPASMDAWNVSGAAIPQVLLYNVYETLVKVDSEGAVKPLLAQTWEVSADQLTYTFHLNPAAKFASGGAVNADAIVANIQRLKADTALTPDKQTEVNLIASTKVLDAQKVEITLTRPSLTWLYEMSSSVGMIVDPSFTGDLAQATAGSGPYTLESFDANESVTLAKNTAYWGNPPHYDEVTFRYFSDPNAMDTAMLSGDLDIISNLQTPETLSQFADTTRFTTTVGTTNGEVVLGMNEKTKALTDLRVRQALTMAIDRKALLSTVWAGQGTLIGSMAVPTDPWYQDLSGTNPYNPTRAKELLKQAGYSGGLTLRMPIPSVNYAVKSAQFVASQLKQVGVTVKIEQLDNSSWLQKVFNASGGNGYDLTIVAHVEPRDLGRFALADNYWHYRSAEFVRLYDTADSTVDLTQANAGMRQAAAYLANDCAAIWLFAMPNLVITTSEVTGVAKNATSLSFDLTTITSR